MIFYLKMLSNKSQNRKVYLLDTLFRRTIVLAGIGTILCVLAILWSILKVIFPLFYENKLVNTPFTLPHKAPLLYLIPDNHLETLVGISQTGELFLQDLASQKIVVQTQLPFSKITYFDNTLPEYFFIHTAKNTSFWNIKSEKFFSHTGQKQFRLKKELLVEFPKVITPHKILYDTVRQLKVKNFLRVSVLANKTILLSTAGVETDFLGQEQSSTENLRLQSKLSGKIVAVFLARDGKNLYLANNLGEIENFVLSDLADITASIFAIENTTKKITTLNSIFGDTSLLVGFSDGSIETFAYTRQKLIKNNEVQSGDGSILALVPSLRNKSFFSISQQGSTFWYLTNTNKILSSQWQEQPEKLFFNANGSAVVSLNKGNVEVWQIKAQHSDFSLASIFKKTQYEGYTSKEYIWQSSSSSDDFEPKYSFIPLIIGSIKGTLYAMIFALPLAIFGAIYINQFAKPWLRNIVKPSIEIMAAIPSVVIGFLAALWLAPLVREHLFSILFYLIVYPFFFLFLFFLFHKPFKKITQKYCEAGTEFLSVIPSLIICFLFTIWASTLLQESFFGGDFIFWLADNFDIAYEQRNAIIISFALGFAVIPIIFTMTDEALSSFPRNLTVASFALGANHWQTLARVIIPTTASGIFAGFIIGFGRAIGETMIVLMATGNSPITSWSLFNGMRTIAANIAVEIPEAPLDDTLYRLLFLSAVLLFLLTFTLNLVAELIRNRLRKKYRF